MTRDPEESLSGSLHAKPSEAMRREMTRYFELDAFLHEHGYLVRSKSSPNREDSSRTRYSAGVEASATLSKQAAEMPPALPSAPSSAGLSCIWASINGSDIAALDPDYEQEPEPEGWADVAVSVIGPHARIIVGDRHGQSCIALDSSGLAELHRRIVIARQRLEEQK